MTSSSEFDADDFTAAAALLSLRPNPVLKLLPVWPSYKKKKRAETHNKASTKFVTTISIPQTPSVTDDVITPPVPPEKLFPMSEQRSVIAVSSDSKVNNQSKSIAEAQMRWLVLMRSNAIFKEAQSRQVGPNPSHVQHQNQMAAVAAEECRAARRRRAEVMRGKSFYAIKIQRLR